MSQQNDPAIRELARLAEIVQNRKDFGEVLSYIEANFSRLTRGEIIPSLLRVLQTAPVVYTTRSLNLYLRIIKATPNLNKKVEKAAIRLLALRRIATLSRKEAVGIGIDIADEINSSNYQRRIKILRRCFSLVKQSSQIPSQEKSVLYKSIARSCDHASFFIEHDRDRVPVWHHEPGNENNPYPKSTLYHKEDNLSPRQWLHQFKLLGLQIRADFNAERCVATKRNYVREMMNFIRTKTREGIAGISRRNLVRRHTRAISKDLDRSPE
jgi:hypothetical protein